VSFGFVTAFIALWVVVVLQGLVVVGLVRELSDLRRLAMAGKLPQRIRIGAQAPRIQGVYSRANVSVDSTDLLGWELVVLFLSADCRICRRLADGVRTLGPGPRQRFIAICRSRADAQPFVDALATDVPVLLDEDGSLHTAFGVTGSPVAFVLDGEGRVRGSGSPQHAGELEELIVVSRQAAGDESTMVTTTA
jgi:peroxiredoxin